VAIYGAQAAATCASTIVFEKNQLNLIAFEKN
jgi:hypothetical protein